MTIAACIAIALASATPAFADQVDATKSIEINVHGRVTEHCAMGQIGDMAFGDLTRPGLSAAARVQFSCNVPFDMKIQAAHGGLANVQYPQGQGPYAGTLPFTMDVAIPVRKPSSSLVGRSFSSRELMGGATLSSAGGIATEGFTLSVALGTPPREAGLLAGQYAETIVITVSPS
jgi:spore coat protein U-like protein